MTTAIGCIGLQQLGLWSMVHCIDMKREITRRRIELGRHIVSDPEICDGQPTFKGTRIMVWIVLEQLDHGLTWDEILREWPGKFPKAAIGEAIAIATLVVKHEPFKGFNVGARRKLARQPAPVAV